MLWKALQEADRDLCKKWKRKAIEDLRGCVAPRSLEQGLQVAELWHGGQEQPALWAGNIFVLTELGSPR